MTATVVMSLDPGRYLVRGGPRGDMVIQRVMRDLGDGRALDRGHRVVRNTARDRWPVLAAFRVPRGGRVTAYGALDAVSRIWEHEPRRSAEDGRAPRCGICHRDAHRPGSRGSYHGHDYQPPA